MCYGTSFNVPRQYIRLAHQVLIRYTRPMNEEETTFWVQVGRTIRNLRRSREMSVDSLAAKVGVTRQQIIRLEAGTTGTPLARLHIIAGALGVALEDLLPSGKNKGQSDEFDLALAFRGRGLSPEEIEKVLDYIALLENARKRD